MRKGASKNRRLFWQLLREQYKAQGLNKKAIGKARKAMLQKAKSTIKIKSPAHWRQIRKGLIKKFNTDFKE